MDTGSDFIQPEFLNILFFKQDNLVIFPYVDLKHLHAFQLFTIGHQFTLLDSAAIYDIKTVLEAEAYNSYSQVPNLYLIHGLNTKSLQDILKMEEENIRCILNVNENVSTLANGAHFIFYNKKSRKFLNYENDDLEFENLLISSSENETALLDSIQMIKITANKIFNELNSSGDENKIKLILREYPSKFWNKILQFTSNYYNVNVPKLDVPDKIIEQHQKTNSVIKSLKHSYTLDEEYTREYDYIIASNRRISNEFIQLLFDYRTTHVNQSNLSMEQLINPSKLFVYLRTHHWNEGIPNDFVSDWIQMKKTGHSLTEDELNSFENVSERLKIDDAIFSDLASDVSFEQKKPNPPKQIIISKECPSELRFTKLKIKNLPKNRKKNPQEIPQIEDFSKFKEWMLKTMDELEELVKEKIQ